MLKWVYMQERVNNMIVWKSCFLCLFLGNFFFERSLKHQCSSSDLGALLRKSGIPLEDLGVRLLYIPVDVFVLGLCFASYLLQTAVSKSSSIRDEKMKYHLYEDILEEKGRLLYPFQTNPGFMYLQYRSIENNVGKSYEQFLLFLRCFLPV